VNFKRVNDLCDKDCIHEDFVPTWDIIPNKVVDIVEEYSFSSNGLIQ
jgi:hypothetical protein